MVESQATTQFYSDIYLKEEMIDASLETDLSFSSDKARSSLAKLIRPKDTKHLLSFPLGLEEKYQKIFHRVEQIIEEIQDKGNFVSVRDDCSINPKPVMLAMPIRKQTH